ncbi:hypothetical protein RMCBS344292_09474 [Rhizopus microsporus]|nr:hypothetical protein RMCBS344292_09474 [Rhizopus microsporus]
MEDVIATVKKQTKSYQRYSNEQKLLFVYYNRIKLFNVAKSGRLAGGISERRAQKWAKKLEGDKGWNIFEKQTNLVNRPKSQLDDRHKLHLLDFYDNWPQVRIVDTMDSLTQKFSDLSLTTQLAARNSPTKIQDRKDWVIKWSATDMNYLENCIFIDESRFNINMRPPNGWLLKGKPAVTDIPTDRAVSHTVLSTITAKFVVSMELRKRGLKTDQN